MFFFTQSREGAEEDVGVPITNRRSQAINNPYNLRIAKCRQAACGPRV